jgi:hypothetical protein
MQHACAILSCLACPAVQYFSALSHKRPDFREKKNIEHKLCFDFLYNFCLKHFPYDQKSTYVGLHVKCPLFLSGSDETRMFSTVCEKSSNINFMKIRPVGAELFHADRRTDMTKLIVAFRNCANVPKNLHFQAILTGTVAGRI